MAETEHDDEDDKPIVDRVRDQRFGSRSGTQRRFYSLGLYAANHRAGAAVHESPSTRRRSLAGG